MLRHIVIALIIIVTVQAAAQAKEAPPRILTTIIPGMINADGSGYYVQLLSRAWEAKKLGIVVLPPKRALKLFSEASEATCFIPLARNMADNLGIDTNGKIFSKSFNTSFGTIISQRGSAPPRSLRAVDGQVVGVQLGFPIADEVVAAAAQVVTPQSLEALLKMLELGRIDIAYVNYPDVALSYAKYGISPFPESEMRFQIVADALACTNDAADWIRRFNESIDRMYENETIGSILGAAYTGR